MVTFDLEPPSVDAWADAYRRDVEEGRYHLLVAEDDGGIEGYVRTTEYREKPAYATSVQTSIYCAPTATGRGVGRALYEALFASLGDGGFHRALAAIALPNPASVALHERFGFVHRGTLTEVGHKLGRYWDVGWWERPLP